MFRIFNVGLGGDLNGFIQQNYSPDFKESIIDQGWVYGTCK